MDEPCIVEVTDVVLREESSDETDVDVDGAGGRLGQCRSILRRAVIVRRGELSPV